MLRNELIIQQVGEEVVVFDPSSKQAHSLLGTTARLLTEMWRQEPASITGEERQAALSELAHLGLTKEGAIVPRMSRRRACGLLGGITAFTVFVPRPAGAASGTLCLQNPNNSGPSICAMLGLNPGDTICGTYYASTDGTCSGASGTEFEVVTTCMEGAAGNDLEVKAGNC